jgi:hypothetical protein
MEKALESSYKKEAMDPIMMDDEQIREIIRKLGVTCSRRPYQYKMNNRKRVVAEQEGLDNNEEEVVDLCAIGKIKDILHITYERKTKGHGSGAEGGSPFQIQIRVKPTTPCATKTSKEEKSVNQHVISGRRIFTRRGSSGNSSRSVSSETSSQVSKGGSTTNFTMKIQDPTIRLPKF